MKSSSTFTKTVCTDPTPEAIPQRRRSFRAPTTTRRLTFIDELNVGGVRLMTSSAPRPRVAIVGGQLTPLHNVAVLRRPGIYIGKWSLKSGDGSILGYVGQSSSDV